MKELWLSVVMGIIQVWNTPQQACEAAASAHDGDVYRLQYATEKPAECCKRFYGGPSDLETMCEVYPQDTAFCELTAIGVQFTHMKCKPSANYSVEPYNQ